MTFGWISGERRRIDVQLSIGGLAETVTITAETPLVDLTSKEIGGNVTNREVTMLPSVNGNFVGMVALLPGVISNVSTESFGSDAISVNGLDSRNNNFMLDGANNNDDVIGQRAGSQARTPLEAVAEFQVITNQYDAEFGRTTGAIINAISKSGTNAFHGVAAGLWQDAGMTQKDFFVKQNGLNKPDTQLQTYRANLGGPVVRDKAHFFFNLERVMIDRANSITIPVAPRVQQLAGDAGPRLEHAGTFRPPAERQSHLGGPLAARVVAAAQSDRARGAHRSRSP